MELGFGDLKPLISYQPDFLSFQPRGGDDLKDIFKRECDSKYVIWQNRRIKGYDMENLTGSYWAGLAL